MALLINKGKCAVKAGGAFFIPGKAVDVDIAVIKKNYPHIAKLISDKILVEVNKTTAKKTEREFERQTLEQLTAKASERGIDVVGKTKDEIITALESK